MTGFAWAVAILPWILLAIATFNTLVWPRGRVAHAHAVSVLVPARNEAHTIASCVESALACAPREVIVLDDGSTDETGATARAVPGVEVVCNDELPRGWVGKPHACHLLAARARGEVLLFVDADTRLSPEAIARISSLFEDYGADIVTAVPRQIVGSFGESLIVPLLHLTYVVWLPLPLVWRTRDPRLLAANGQVLAVRRDALDRIGGFAAIRDEVVDDMALCRRAKASGLRVVFADGHDIATARMYRSFREAWSGFTKNLYEGIGASPAMLALVLTAYALPFLGPFVMLPFAVVPALVGVIGIVLLRVLVARRHAQPWTAVLAHPISIAVFLALAVASWRRYTAGRIEWRGRTYAPRHERAVS